MGGEGAMMAANNSLKNNRNLLSKRKETKALQGSYANIELKKFPKASESQLEAIKNRFQLENKKRRIKLVVFSAMVLIAIVILVLYLI